MFDTSSCCHVHILLLNDRQVFPADRPPSTSVFLATGEGEHSRFSRYECEPGRQPGKPAAGEGPCWERRRDYKQPISLFCSFSPYPLPLFFPLNPTTLFPVVVHVVIVVVSLSTPLQPQSYDPPMSSVFSPMRENCKLPPLPSPPLQTPIP